MAVVSGSVCRAEVRDQSDIFPNYACIQPNVDFWLKVYTHYSSDQGVIHDKYHMDRIYGVIPLVDPYRGGGRKVNNKRIKAAKKKYKAILSKLMQGKPPAGPEEQRVARQFDPQAGAAVFRSALRNIRCQTGQKDRFRAGLIRSGAYIDEIKQIFRDAGLPQDLAFLPHVESSFNPRAYSKFGAAGMWQFTRATGKRFMKVGYTIDERRDPILASFAAAKLLGNNYGKLNSWPLAITAYNHGVAGMRRALRKKGSYERIFKEYRSRSFRFASRNFYAEFLAAREAAKNYRQYFGDLELNRPRKTHSIELSGYVSLPEVARHLNLDLAELRGLNPALRGPVFSGQKYVPRGYRLQLPERKGTDWDQLVARLPRNLYRENQKRSSIYTVRRGDTAGKIARRHGVRLNDLIAANNLDRRATIYVNQNLRIPLPEPKPTIIAEQTKKTASLPPTPASNRVPANPAVLSAAVDPAMRPSAAGTNSTAVAGRRRPATREKVSESVPQNDYAMTTPPIDQLALSPQQAMALNPAVLKLSLIPAIVQGHFAVERVSTRGGKSVGHIRVEAEETLGHYAEWLNVAAGELRRLNGLRYGRPLHLSQRIKIPLHRVTKNEFEVKRFEYHQELAEDFFESYRVEKVWTYSIKKGDNIWTLSHREFEVPVWLIKQFNGHVDFGALVPSQKLIVPVVEKDV
jgi:membrane-bound lytic murein transglycosylase D